MEHTVKKRISLRWIAAAVCAFLGASFVFVFTSIQFTGFIFFGIAAVICCYELLNIYSRKNKRKAKLLTRILSCLLVLGLAAASITGAVIYKGSLGQASRDCQYVVVLGAGVNGSTPSLSLKERICGAYDYLSAHEDAICIVSGGQGDGEDITEAACMFRELTEMGIPAQRIWLEEQSSSTRENLRFSLDLIEAKTGTRPSEIGLVSSEYHLYRAGLFAREQGVRAYGIPAKTDWLSLRVNYFLREIVAVWFYALAGN